jgi:hypothetical protein
VTSVPRGWSLRHVPPVVAGGRPLEELETGRRKRDEMTVNRMDAYYQRRTLKGHCVHWVKYGRTFALCGAMVVDLLNDGDAFPPCRSCVGRMRRLSAGAPERP